MQLFTNFGDNEQKATLIPTFLSKEPAESYGDDAQGDEPFWAHQFTSINQLTPPRNKVLP